MAFSCFITTHYQTVAQDIAAYCFLAARSKNPATQDLHLPAQRALPGLLMGQFPGLPITTP